MNRKGLAILMRTRMRLTDPNKLSVSPNEASRVQSDTGHSESDENFVRVASEGYVQKINSPSNSERDFNVVRESMHAAISMNKTEVMDAILNNFSEGYHSLSHDNRRKLLIALARDYDVNRKQVRELIQQYLGLEFPGGDKSQPTTFDEGGLLAALYRTERNLRHALKPMYQILFERLNTHPGGLKFLSILRADILSMLAEENIASLRALDSYLKEKLVTWLSPATLELHRITWDDPASLLEKIVAYEAVHPINSLIDLKRRLGIGRRCFGYLHPSIPGEPLIFIEVALLKNVAQNIQEVLWDHPPIPESEATCALFYSISSTQSGLVGINLGKFLIKRVIELVKKDMPHVSTFATLSPIRGYMKWLLFKLGSQSKLAEAEKEGISCSLERSSSSTFRENILQPEEEKALLESSVEFTSGENGMEMMLNLLTSKNYEWTKSDRLLSVLQAPLMRLCARYDILYSLYHKELHKSSTQGN
ncbi:PREDICTED: malonyl-CoA decarboxylase, mitochondrial isoform X2 [Nelumbo nucifera]|uniref:Malonyl-CoA decarboxylase, mitochondrial isoform X2 n=1 Tax=Nelumbo nucifera TaxID=4432 RepID=A0A1U7ZFK2_NELNU|nr:PREDICTED: malonyl-CoA decarboxylase, mitochondrial isoform X2 [Nelumbo nucifera]